MMDDVAGLLWSVPTRTKVSDRRSLVWMAGGQRSVEL